MKLDRSPLFTLIRGVGEACLVVWVLMCVWAWWWQGTYAECGVGWRLMGFASWGLGLSLLPAMLLLPPVDRKGKMRWGEPACLSRMFPVLLHCLLLVWLSLDIPTADDAGDILAAVGMVWAILVNTGTIVLILVLSGIAGCWRRNRLRVNK